MTSSSGMATGTPPSTSEDAPISQAIVKDLTFDMTERALMKALEATSTEDIKAFVASLEVIQSRDIEVSLYTIFEFQGFDPWAIIRKLLTINRHYRETLGHKEESLEKLKEDVMFMIAANLYMGNLQEKSLSRRPAAGRTKVQNLIKKYNMKRGTTGAGQPSDQLTFPRVANSFPVLTCRMASVLPSKDFVGTEFDTRDLPKFMRISSFASLCDSQLEERSRLFLLHCVCSYSCDQTIVVHEGEKKKKKMKKSEDVMTPIDAYSLQWEFINVASTSPVPTREMKKALMLEFSISTRYDTLVAIVRRFRNLIGDSTPLPAKPEFEGDVEGFINKPS
jgi:hypothetical protein